MTRQRQLIYDIVSGSPAHMTAEEIFSLARKQMPSVARGTVYRNLGILTRERKIGRLEMPDAPARYDRLSRPHPHLVCEVCGRVEDIDLPEQALRALFRLLDSEITGYDLRLYHICPDCKIKQEEQQ